MSKLIQMPYQDGSIVVEVETTEGEIIPVSRTGERLIKEAQEAFDKVEGVIVDSCTLLTGALKRLAEKEPTLESASVECGFQFTGEGNLYLVKTAAEGSIKVTLNLKLSKT